MSSTMVKLEKVCDVIRGVTFKPEDLVPPFTENSIVVMRTKNVQVKGLDYEDLISIPIDLIKDQKKVLIDGDLLISSANSWYLVGKTSFFETNKLASPVTAGGFISIIRPKASIKSKYLYHWLTTDKSQHKIRHLGRQTTNISNLDFKQFKKLEIPLPSLPEQQRIADILDKAEAINQKREQALALCDEFLRATFLNMFGDPVSNPKGWKVDKLKNLTSINPKPDKSKLQNININEGVSFVPMAAVCEVDKKVTEYERRPLNEVIKGFTYFEKEDVILAKITPCFENGKMAHLNNLPTDIGYGSTEFHVFRVSNKTIMPEYLFNMLKLEYFLEMGAFKMRGAAGQRRVPIEFFGEFVMPIPPIELQQKFSEIVEKVNAIKAHIQHAQELPLFDALSQQAFKGELTQ